MTEPPEAPETTSPHPLLQRLWRFLNEPLPVAFLAAIFGIVATLAAQRYLGVPIPSSSHSPITEPTTATDGSIGAVPTQPTPHGSADEKALELGPVPDIEKNALVTIHNLDDEKGFDLSDLREIRSGTIYDDLRLTPQVLTAVEDGAELAVVSEPNNYHQCAMADQWFTFLEFRNLGVGQGPVIE